SPGWIFGYINSAYRVSGTLINHNHFAGLLEMIIPAAIGLAYLVIVRSSKFAKGYVYLLTGAFMGLALLLSLSRMGIVSFTGTLFAIAMILLLERSSRRLAVGLTFTLAGLVVTTALWIGVDVIVNRYSELLAEEGLIREGRILVFRDVARMISDHPMGV